MDEWSAGFRAACELRSLRDVRERLLRTDARYWPAERLEGFLYGHEYVTQSMACTCRDCPIHHDAPAEAGTN